MSSTQSYPFTTPANYTYDSSLVEITGGVAKLKDIRPSNSTCAALFDSSIDLTWGDGTLTGTGTGSPTISSGQLDLTGASNQYIDYDADLNADSQQTGCMRMDYIPNYTGNPGNGQYIFGAFQAHNNGTNSVQIYHDTAKRLYILIKSSSGSTLVQSNLGTWNVTAGVTYTLELNWDLTAGAIRLFIDGAQHGSTLTTTGTRSSSIGLLRIGQHVSGTTGQSDFKADNFVYFTGVQHTSNHAGDLPFDDPVKYSEANPMITTNTSVLSTEITSFTVTDTIAGSDNIKHIVQANGQARYVTGGTASDSDGTYSQASTDTEMASDISNIISTRTICSFKIFLHSEYGGTTPEIDLLEVVYNPAIANPTTATLVNLEGFIYDNDGPVDSELIQIRPYTEGSVSEGVFHIYDWKDLATTDSNGYFNAFVYASKASTFWEFKIGPQRYYAAIPDQDEVDFKDLTLVTI